MIAAQPIAEATMQNRIANRRTRLVFDMFENRLERFVACIGSFPSYVFPRPSELSKVATSVTYPIHNLPDRSSNSMTPQLCLKNCVRSADM